MEEKDKSDYFGCWSGRSFFSEKSILDRTTSIGCVNRKLATGMVKQDFRHYLNKNGRHRIVMMSEDAESEDRSQNGEYFTYITNGDFFLGFLSGMRRCGEITESEFRNISGNLENIGIKESEENKEDIQKIQRPNLTEEDIEELNSI